ncbi:MAG: hypothetical protein IK079_02725 [Desulfovibrio sp.]|nr:hypothetical protein [Desulfovibrio sp.]
MTVFSLQFYLVLSENFYNLWPVAILNGEYEVFAFHPLDESAYLRKSVSDAAFQEKIQIIPRIQEAKIFLFLPFSYSVLHPAWCGVVEQKNDRIASDFFF